MNDCSNVVDITNFISSCHIDYCTNPTDETLSEIYQTFFDACRKVRGPHGSVCDWKKKLGYNDCPGEQELAFSIQQQISLTKKIRQVRLGLAAGVNAMLLLSVDSDQIVTPTR